MKKILFVNSSLTSGGSERVMTLIANEFSSRKYSVDMVLLYNYGYDTYEVNKNIKVIRFYCESKIKIVKKLRQILRLRKVIKNDNYDCIISFMQSINIVTLLSCIGLKKKVIVSERCNPMARKNIIKNILSNILYKKSSHIVLQTNQVKEYFNAGIQSKSVIIANPVNNNIPNPYKGVKAKKIVGVGRLTNQKNFKLLIDAFIEFSKNHEDYILEIYGEGPLLSSLSDYCIVKSINDKVYFMGFVKDIPNRIKNATMFVSTSDYEGISNSMIESLAMGIPTICTDCPVGGAKMMIENNENGVLIPVGDCNALVDAMNKISNDEFFSKKIGNNAIKIRENYSLGKIVDEWEKIVN